MSLESLPSTYSCWSIRDYNNPLELLSFPIPIVNSFEVLVKVHAASINPIDYKIMDGMLKMINDEVMPLKVGFDLAGVVL